MSAQLPLVGQAQAGGPVRFSVLGPLEVWTGPRRLAVGGPKQRAILGYLLVHANEVVATSRMVRDLWPGGAPSTARKMLQNTASSVRGLLSAHDRGGSTALLTHPPGYLLRIDADGLDLLGFEQLARTGRAALADGDWPAASRALREALDLWRGEPLADLRDAGISLSRLGVLRESRVTALEDYFEAELCLGHHHERVAALEQLVADEPHRERAAHQLMLALYRCGRQVDALGVFRRTSIALRDGLGLEPTRTLRDLERAILAHDAVLSPPTGASVQVEPVAPRTSGPRIPGRRTSARRAAAPRIPVPEQVTRPRAVARSSSERTLVSILTVALEVHRDGADGAADGPADTAADEVDAVLAEAGSGVRGDVDAAGGRVLFCTGSMIQAVFGVGWPCDQEALVAVRTAVGLLDRFARAGDPVRPRLSIRTEEVLVESRGGVVDVVGSALEQCMQGIRALPPHQVWVCDATRRRGDLDVADTMWHGQPAAWWARVAEIRSSADGPDLPFVDRDHELAILGHHLDQTIRRQRGRLVTVLGEAGIGKSRLVSEWLGRLRTMPEPPLVLRTAVPPDTPWGVRTMVAELVACLRGVPPDGVDRFGSTPVDQLLAMIARRGVAVLVVEDMHRGDEATRAFVAMLTARTAVLPMLAVTTARPDAPGVEAEHGRALTTMTLDRISDAAVERLWNAALAAGGGPARRAPGGLARQVDGNPALVIDLARRYLDDPGLAPGPPSWREPAGPPLGRRRSGSGAPGPVAPGPVGTGSIGTGSIGTAQSS